MSKVKIMKNYGIGLESILFIFLSMNSVFVCAVVVDFVVGMINFFKSVMRMMMLMFIKNVKYVVFYFVECLLRLRFRLTLNSVFRIMIKSEMILVMILVRMVLLES